MWRQDRGEFAVMTLTTLVIVATALLEGVLIGLAAGIVLAALRMSQTVIRQHVEDDTAKVVMAGNATFLRLPKVIEALEAAAASGKPRIRLDLTGVTHLDHACRSQIEEFTAQQRGSGLRVELLMPGPASAQATPDPTAQQTPVRPPPPTHTSTPTRTHTHTSTPTPTAAFAPSADLGPDGPDLGTGSSSGPGPGAEWFYLDTRPLPDDYAGAPRS